jgi:hypothetical protein
MVRVTPLTLARRISNDLATDDRILIKSIDRAKPVIAIGDNHFAVAFISSSSGDSATPFAIFFCPSLRGNY